MVHKKSVPNKPGFPLSTLTSTKNQFLKKTGFPLPALIILDWSNVDLLLFKKESGKNRIMVNRVCLAIPQRATITCRDRKKLRS